MVWVTTLTQAESHGSTEGELVARELRKLLQAEIGRDTTVDLWRGTYTLPGSSNLRFHGYGTIAFHSADGHSDSLLDGRGDFWDVDEARPSETVSRSVDLRRIVDSKHVEVMSSGSAGEKNTLRGARHMVDHEGSGLLQTCPLKPEADYLAPDGSKIRLMPTMKGGGLCHCPLPAGKTSSAVIHRQVEEIWYVLEGRGDGWRNDVGGGHTVSVSTGISLTNPPHTAFQFRNTGDASLCILIVTMPPWPGPHGAGKASGVWLAILVAGERGDGMDKVEALANEGH